MDDLKGCELREKDERSSRISRIEIFPLLLNTMRKSSDCQVSSGIDVVRSPVLVMQVVFHSETTED